MSYAIKPLHFKVFDRYDFIKSLVALTSDDDSKELEAKKAEVIATAIQELQNSTFQNLTTKDDLKNLEFLLKKDIKTFESSLRGEMQTFESSLKGEMQTLESSLRGEMKILESSLKGEMQTFESSLKGEMQTFESSIRGEMKTLEVSLKKDMQGHLIKLGSLMVMLLTALPLLTDLIKHWLG